MGIKSPEVVGSDVYSDIAVVRISAGLKAKAVAEFGDSNQLTVGETAIAVVALLRQIMRILLPKELFQPRPPM